MLASYAAAALREYIDMFAARAMTTAAELREKRLLAILLVPGQAFPSDELVARLFNMTTVAARTLLRTTLSRHRIRLAGVVSTAARAFRIGCVQQQPPGGEWNGRCANAVLIEVLNDQLATAAQPRGPIRRLTGTFDTYLVPNGSYNELQQWYP